MKAVMCQGTGVGALAGFTPRVTATSDTLFGLARAPLPDETAVPLTRSGSAPRKPPVPTHAYSAAPTVVAEQTRPLARAAL